MSPVSVGCRRFAATVSTSLMQIVVVEGANKSKRFGPLANSLATSLARTLPSGFRTFTHLMLKKCLPVVFSFATISNSPNSTILVSSNFLASMTSWLESSKSSRSHSSG